MTKLLDMFGKPEVTENLNRILARIEHTDKHLFAIDDEAKLIAAVADATKDLSYLTADITLTATLVIAQDFILYGEDFDLTDATLDANQYMAMQISGNDVEIDSVKFAISGDSDANALYSIDVGGKRSNIHDCEFVMANAGSSGAVSVYYEGGTANSGHVLKDNVLSNGVALTGNADFAEISGNTFAATKGFGLGECTINGIHYNAYDPVKYAKIVEYLVAQGNTTTGGTLVVTDYFAP